MMTLIMSTVGPDRFPVIYIVLMGLVLLGTGIYAVRRRMMNRYN